MPRAPIGPPHHCMQSLVTCLVCIYHSFIRTSTLWDEVDPRTVTWPYMIKICPHLAVTVTCCFYSILSELSASVPPVTSLWYRLVSNDCLPVGQQTATSIWIRFTDCLYRRTCGSSRLAWSKGRRPPGAVLHSSREPRKLTQWLWVMM